MADLFLKVAAHTVVDGDLNARIEVIPYSTAPRFQVTIADMEAAFDRGYMD